MLWSKIIEFILQLFYMPHLLEEKEDIFAAEAIQETWDNSFLEICSDPAKNFAGDSISSYRFQNGFEWINLEIRNFQPLLIRFVGFIPPHLVKSLQKMHDNLELEEMKVHGGDGGDYASKARIAKGYWITKSDQRMAEIYRKLRNVLKMNLMASEDFLMLSYDKNGHYAPHYDFLNLPEDSDNYWFQNFGDRLATALLIVKKADEGGGTIFPNLNIVVSPDPGDVILWFNANLKFEQENLSFHGACPILGGRKIAMSLWIRCRQHKDLQCQADYGNDSHQLADILRVLGY